MTKLAAVLAGFMHQVLTLYHHHHHHHHCYYYYYYYYYYYSLTLKGGQTPGLGEKEYS